MIGIPQTEQYRVPRRIVHKTVLRPLHRLVIHVAEPLQHLHLAPIRIKMIVDVKRRTLRREVLHIVARQWHHGLLTLHTLYHPRPICAPRAPPHPLPARSDCVSSWPPSDSFADLLTTRIRPGEDV